MCVSEYLEDTWHIPRPAANMVWQGARRVAPIYKYHLHGWHLYICAKIRIDNFFGSEYNIVTFKYLGPLA